MNKTGKTIAFLLVAVMFLLVGCVKTYSKTEKEEKSSVKKKEEQSVGSYNFSEAGFGSGEDLSWPEYIPGAIPELEGEISLIFADTYKIRIFLNGVTEKDLEEYIQTMKSEGYSVEYIIYEIAGFPDKSEEKSKKGEFDAVKFIKDNYEVFVEQGEDTAVLDIVSSKFSKSEKDLIDQIQNPSYEWPGNLEFPQPEGSKIETIQNAADGSLAIICTYERENNANEYTELMLQLGFEKIKQNKNQNGGIINVTFEKGDTVVKIDANVLSRLSFSIWLDGSYVEEENMHPDVIDGNWPRTLPESVPPFTHGTVDTALSTGENQFTVMVTAENEDSLSDYIDILLENGFIKTGMEQENKFSNGEYEITLQTLMMSDIITIKIDKTE